MKRSWICGLLALCLAFCLTIPAFAAPLPAPVILNADNAETDQTTGAVVEGTGDTYTVAYETGETQENVGKQFVLLVLKKDVTPENMDVDSILYIDQAASAWDGSKAVVTFEGFKLKRRVEADVWIGGGDSPVNPWFIKVAGISPSGTITLVAGDKGAATIMLLNPTDGEMEYKATTEGGAYEFTGVESGAYDVRIEKAGYLPVTLKNVDLAEAAEIADVNMAQYGGDFNGDGKVDYKDLNMLTQDFSKPVIKQQIVDINGDNKVNYKDLNALTAGFSKGSTKKDSQNRPIGVVISAK